MPGLIVDKITEKQSLSTGASREALVDKCARRHRARVPKLVAELSQLGSLSMIFLNYLPSVLLKNTLSAAASRHILSVDKCARRHDD